jgi:hypothetical protein
VKSKELIWGEHPAPSGGLPEDVTYFALGCGRPDCPHSVSFEAAATDATIISEIIDGVSPRRATHKSLTLADANTVCPRDGKECPSGEKIDRAVTILVSSGLLDHYLEK